MLDLASFGEIDIFDDELSRKMGDYICYTYINDEYNFNYAEIKNFGAKESLVADMYLKNSQVVVARSKASTTDGFFFGVKGGYNDEFGNQNDVGTFVLYVNGKPFIVDPGSSSKTSKAIGNKR